MNKIVNKDLNHILDIFYQLISLITLFSLKKGYPIKLVYVKPESTTLIPLGINEAVRMHLTVLKLREILEFVETLSPELVIETWKIRIIDNKLYGPIDLPLTITLKSTGRPLFASYKILRSTESPEMILLSQIIKIIEDNLDKLIELKEKYINDPILNRSITNIIDMLAGMERSIEWIKDFLPPARPIDNNELYQLAKEVLERGHIYYRKLAYLIIDYINFTNLLNYIATKTIDKQKSNRRYLGLAPERLFELYIFYSIASSLINILSSHKVIKQITLAITGKSQFIEVNVEDKKYTVYHDTELTGLSWLEDKVNNIKAGRPDISVVIDSKGQRRVLLVIDTKFRTKKESIYFDRGRVLGYMHEYRAPCGILVYDKTILTEQIDATLVMRKYDSIYYYEIPLELNRSTYNENVVEKHLKIFESLLNRILSDLGFSS